MEEMREKSGALFYREVTHRVRWLEVSVLQMAVAEWCREPEHIRALWGVCRDTVAFMVPPSEENSQAWRGEVWSWLSETWPDALKALLLLSGSSVLRHQGEQGEVYAGAVLHCLLKGWLEQHGKDMMKSARRSMDGEAVQGGQEKIL